jgi:CarboxypepD_reg-like domain
MSTNDSYRNYSSGDIQKYLAGELSATEMHALESAALDDPFLADALEGIETDRGLRGANALSGDMEELKKRLAARIAEKRKSAIPLYHSWWRVAAAAVLLAGLAVFSSRYFLTGRRSSPDSSSELAKSEKQTAPAESPATSTQPVATPDDHTATGAKPAAAPTKTDIARKMPGLRENEVMANPRSTIEKDKAQKATTYGNRDDLAYKKDLADKDNYAFKNAEINRKKLIRAYYFGKSPTDTMHLAFTPTSRLFSDSSQYSFAPADKKLLNGRPLGFASNSGVGSNHYFVGKVIDSNNNPIPYATISFFNKQQAARTDNNGVFQFQLLGSPDSSTPVMISSVGYFPVSLTLNALTRDNDALSNIIRMQPEENALAPAATYKENRAARNALAGNALVNNTASDNAASDNSAKDEDLAQRAAPVIGWVAYQDYLKKYKPSHAIDSTLKGNEIVSFQVDRKGKLSSFKIEQSLSPAHDSLLIRLIKKGPVWKPLEGKKAGAIVIMAF